MFPYTEVVQCSYKLDLLALWGHAIPALFPSAFLQRLWDWDFHRISLVHQLLFSSATWRNINNGATPIFARLCHDILIISTYHWLYLNLVTAAGFCTIAALLKQFVVLNRSKIRFWPFLIPPAPLLFSWTEAWHQIHLESKSWIIIARFELNNTNSQLPSQ